MFIVIDPAAFARQDLILFHEDEIRIIQGGTIIRIRMYQNLLPMIDVLHEVDNVLLTLHLEQQKIVLGQNVEIRYQNQILISKMDICMLSNRTFVPITPLLL